MGNVDVDGGGSVSDESNVVKIGSGGRLYRDAREKESRGRLLKKLTTSGAFVPDEDDQAIVDKAELPDEEPALPPKLPPHADRPEPKRTPPPQQPAWGTSSTWQPPEEEIPADWRGIISTALEIGGIAGITTGFWELADWLGPIALGVCLILMGVALGIPPGTPLRKARNTPHAR